MSQPSPLQSNQSRRLIGGGPSRYKHDWCYLLVPYVQYARCISCVLEYMVDCDTGRYLVSVETRGAIHDFIM